MASNEIYKQLLIYDVNYFSLYRTELSKTTAGFSGLITKLDNLNTSNPTFYEVFKQDTMI